MARSSRIYLLIDGGGFPLAAFTVKREMYRWLERNQPEYPRLYICGDGVIQVHPRPAAPGWTDQTKPIVALDPIP